MCTLPGVTYHIPSRSYVVVLVSTFACPWGVPPFYGLIILYVPIYSLLFYMDTYRQMCYNIDTMERVCPISGHPQEVSNMSVSEAQKKASIKYLEKLDEIRIRMPKGEKNNIKEAASAAGESMNQYIINAVDQRMERDKRESGE